MLAMWHRVVTRRTRFDPYEDLARLCQDDTLRINAIVRTHPTAFVLADVVVGCSIGRGSNMPDDLGTCRPISDITWVEFSVCDRQYGVMVMLLQNGHISGNCAVRSFVFGTQDGEPAFLGWFHADYDEDGKSIVSTGDDFLDRLVKPHAVINRARHIAKDDPIALAEIAECRNIANQTFAFMHCKNVELIDCTKEHGPDEKWCRRQKVPSVIYKTLKIPGMTKRYADGGGHSGVEMRSHICRGHFATYTADKPLFGRPDGVGKFWHPAHVRGNAKHGAVVKDYEVST